LLMPGCLYMLMRISLASVSDSSISVMAAGLSGVGQINGLRGLKSFPATLLLAEVRLVGGSCWFWVIPSHVGRGGNPNSKTFPPPPNTPGSVLR
jgi:hypothetical protein